MEEICKNGIMQAKQLDKLHDKQVRTQTGALPVLPPPKERERGGGGEMGHAVRISTGNCYRLYGLSNGHTPSK